MQAQSTTPSELFAAHLNPPGVEAAVHQDTRPGVAPSADCSPGVARSAASNRLGNNSGCIVEQPVDAPLVNSDDSDMYTHVRNAQRGFWNDFDLDRQRYHAKQHRVSHRDRASASTSSQAFGHPIPANPQAAPFEECEVSASRKTKMKTKTLMTNSTGTSSPAGLSSTCTASTPSKRVSTPSQSATAKRPRKSSSPSTSSTARPPGQFQCTSSTPSSSCSSRSSAVNAGTPGRPPDGTT